MVFQLSTLLLVLCSTLPAATIYDLKTDWSDTNNPNGVWAYRQGSNTLPHNDVSVCCGGPSAGITGAWAPSPFAGDFLPLWAKATGNNSASGFLAGDIIVHSVDGFNGNPTLGEANIIWTAPMAGTIDISGSIWYAHFPLVRSNDFVLMLDATKLASGTVSATNGATRANPLAFGVSGLGVNAGDVVELIVERSPGQAAGSFDGVNLTVTETPGAAVPEPGTAGLLTLALTAFVIKSARSASDSVSQRM
jgi:hypothetical protein